MRERRTSHSDRTLRKRGLAVALMLALTPGAIAQATADDAKLPDAAVVQETIDLAQKQDFDGAFAVAGRVGDPALKKIVEWYYVQSDGAAAGFNRISAFARENPAWPRLSAVAARAEFALYLKPEKPDVVIGYFDGEIPRTGAGGIALARAFLAVGDKPKARETIGRTWRTKDLSASMEKTAIKEMGDLIDGDDRHHRLSLMIYRQLTHAAIRAASYMSKDHQAMARAAIAFLGRARNASSLYKKVPAELRSDPALTYARVNWNRKRNREDTAAKLLLAAPRVRAKRVHPESWWTEQRVLARDILKPGKKKNYPIAYRLVAGHGLDSGAEFVEAEFMAGFIALRFLKQPEKALKHFRKVESDATIPETQARADYWIGRCLAALGKREDAERRMTSAASLSSTYYGQLARDFLGLEPDPEEYLRRPGAPQLVYDTLFNSEVGRVLRLVALTDERILLTSFATSFAEGLTTGEQRLALAQMVWNLGAPHLTLRIARIAQTRGDNFGRLAFPTTLLPQYKPLVASVDKALVYGLIRQESEFNPRAQSWAGAGGLMQIMPGTARMIAKDHGQPYSKSRLTSDPAYNVRLGTAHIHDLLKRFDGSYIMTIAGYNAGPGRSHQWMKRFGDPRTGAIDPIDWVELIPFSETRLYVQKVLQNVQVYRTLFDRDGHISLLKDLNRGTDKKTSASAANCLGKRGQTMTNLIECATQ